jgi:hypothetical protein
VLALRLPEPVWVDLEEARTALDVARQAQSAEEALDNARRANELLRDGLLPGLEATWLDEERERLADLRVEALELMARAERDSDPVSAERAAREAVALAPFRESAWVALIHAVDAQGNPAQALRAYEEIRVRLREELGLTPGPELVALHRRLLARGDEAASAPADGGRFARGPGAPRTDLVERDAELRLIDHALAETAEGTGRMILFEGAAGIGKTRLLGELVARAAGRDMLVLSARASLLERDYAFGVVRQLFEGAIDPERLEGPAEAARIVLEDAAADTGEGIFRVLSALFHVVCDLARTRPVLLAMDDLQWSDPASLRFVAYLARRVEPLRVCVGASVRTGEPEAEDPLLGELSAEPVTVLVTPRPLSAEATGRLVRERLGAQAESEFIRACHEVTGGNPLLVGQLLHALATESVAPEAAGAPTVYEIGPRAVGRAVLLRLSRLPAPAIAVARAVAVLGEHAALPAIAALAETDEALAARALQALARAEILRGEAPLGFVHLLVRDAIYHELPPAARALEHERAARILAESSASPEQVAAQLLLAAPRGDAWVVERLREAARVAMRRGAPDAAMSLLERAQAEPPGSEVRAELALERGGALPICAGPPASSRCRGPTPSSRIRARAVTPPSGSATCCCSCARPRWGCSWPSAQMPSWSNSPPMSCPPSTTISAAPCEQCGWWPPPSALRIHGDSIVWRTSGRVRAGPGPALAR